ncbi:hypothetical protein A6U89_32405 [Agrobacterium sp. B133/95]|nr:hypothetical protein A6U89_32405 [Agrobacterium sp. B133/95]
MKTITVKYVTETKTGSFEYRRQVPAALRQVLGRYEFKRVLGPTKAAAIKAYSELAREIWTTGISGISA